MHSRLELRHRKPQQQLSDVIYFDAVCDCGCGCGVLLCEPQQLNGVCACEWARRSCLRRSFRDWVGLVQYKYWADWRWRRCCCRTQSHSHMHALSLSLSLSLSIFAYLSLARTDAVVESGFQSAFVKLKELCCWKQLNNRTARVLLLLLLLLLCQESFCIPYILYMLYMIVVCIINAASRTLCHCFFH